MAYKNLLVLLVSVFALAALQVGSASAFGSITNIEVDGVSVVGGVDLANFVGDRVPIRVEFLASADASDVRMKAWISGESQNLATSERFDVIAGKTYTRTIYLDVPVDLKKKLNEGRKLEIRVESRDGIADEKTVDFTVQRESYSLKILSATMQPEVNVGEPLVVDVVLKNLGSHFADDTFLTLTIPELGLETRTYFGDLSPVDQPLESGTSDRLDKEDAVERRTYLRIPANVKPGLYTVELEALNSDSYDRVERRILIAGGAVENTLVASAGQSETFATGEKGTYKMTVVNRGTVVQVFELKANVPDNLNVDLSDSLIVVPAGSSRTVEITADSALRDDYTFSVDVLSEDGALVKTQTYRANVVDGKGSSTSSVAGNTTVLLTVILAIVFVVLLVVLIVLLTRKPETKEEFGESYY